MTARSQTIVTDNRNPRARVGLFTDDDLTATATTTADFAVAHGQLVLYCVLKETSGTSDACVALGTTGLVIALIAAREGGDA